METQELTVRSTRRQHLVDITENVRELVREWNCSAIAVYVPHTTAGVLINEHADPDVAGDMLRALDEMVPADAGYRHLEGNSPAHVKATMVGTSQIVPLHSGRLLLGRWQGVFLAEFDGPRTRTVIVAPLGA